MRTFVLIAVLGAVGLSAILWSGTGHAQVRPLQRVDPCVTLWLEVESGDAGPVADWPQARILQALFCAFKGDPGPLHLVPPTVALQGSIALAHFEVDQKQPE